MVTARICAKILPQTLPTKELAVASQQCAVSYFFTREFFYQKQQDCPPPPTLLFFLSPVEDKTEEPPFSHNWSDQGKIVGCLNILTEHGFQDAFKKWQEHWEQCILAELDYFEGLVFYQMAVPVVEIMEL
jgi:hypothetical protein